MPVYYACDSAQIHGNWMNEWFWNSRRQVWGGLFAWLKKNKSLDYIKKIKILFILLYYLYSLEGLNPCSAIGWTLFCWVVWGLHEIIYSVLISFSTNHVHLDLVQCLLPWFWFLWIIWLSGHSSAFSSSLYIVYTLRKSLAFFFLSNLLC
jgi:hypothetical protein